MRRCLIFVKEHPFWEKYPLWLCVATLVVIWIAVSLLITLCFGESTRGLAYLLALPLVITGLYLAYRRTQSLESQNKTDSDRLLAETFAKSIELLGDDQAAVRQGAIYALGKIAETNTNELTVIVNTLCAFIRHNQKRPEDEACNKSRRKEEGSELIILSPIRKGSKSKQEDSKLEEKENNILNIDIEAAVRIIVKLSSGLKSEDYSNGYDLSNIYLPYADFSRAKLVNFNLSDCCFYKCGFENTDFSNSNLVSSMFHESDFQSATFDENTEIMKADFSKAEKLDLEMIQKAQGNQETRLPEGMKIPDNWQGS